MRTLHLIVMKNITRLERQGSIQKNTLLKEVEIDLNTKIRLKELSKRFDTANVEG